MAKEFIVSIGKTEISRFDALRIHSNDFTITSKSGEEKYTFRPQEDGAKWIFSADGEHWEIKASGDFSGVEYEQIYSDLPDLIPPKIYNVKINTLDSTGGIYKLSISKTDCTFDSRANPFVFFKSSDGVFKNYTTDSNGSRSVIFEANPDSAESNIRVMVGIGDGLGQIDRKTITL